MIQHQQPPRGRDSSSLFDDYAGAAARVRGMQPRHATALGLPIGEKIHRKHRGVGGVGHQNGSQSDSGDDVNLDAVAFGDNESCYLDSKSDDDACIPIR